MESKATLNYKAKNRKYFSGFVFIIFNQKLFLCWSLFVFGEKEFDNDR